MKRKYFSTIMSMVFIGGILGCTKPVEIIAHRGASYLAPENTMASIQLAWKKNADVEVDVHLSQDHRVMVIHDATTGRTAGKNLVVKETLSQELRLLEVGSFKGKQYAGEPIPFLEDIIQTIPARRKLFVEIKCGPEILPHLQQILEDSGKMSQIVIIGFDRETMILAKKRMCDVPVYWLKGTVKNEQTQTWIPHDPALLRSIQENGLDGLNVHYAGVDKPFMDTVKASGQKLYVWTVDDPAEAKRLVKLGVKGITTNRPAWLRKQLP